MKYSRNVKSVKMVRNGVLLKFSTNFQEFRRFQFRRSVYQTYFRNNFRMELVKSLSNSLEYRFQYRRFPFQNLQDSFHRVFHQVLLSWLSNMHLRIKMRINLYPESGTFGALRSLGTWSAVDRLPSGTPRTRVSHGKLTGYTQNCNSEHRIPGWHESKTAA